MEEFKNSESPRSTLNLKRLVSMRKSNLKIISESDIKVTIFFKK